MCKRSVSANHRGILSLEGSLVMREGGSSARGCMHHQDSVIRRRAYVCACERQVSVGMPAAAAVRVYV